jgi:hypothetical protein
VMKKQRLHLHRIGTKPNHEKLPWPGLKARDHLSRVVSRAVKDAKDTREKEEWAESQIARVLDFVPPETAAKLIFLDAYRRRSLTPESRKLFSEFLARWRILNWGNRPNRRDVF